MIRIRKMIPHAALLIAHMYYVFFGIDRVNRAMNFINNGITKTLLLLLVLATALNVGRLYQNVSFIRRRRKVPQGQWLLTAVLAAAGVLSVVTLIFLLVDVCAPGGMIFMNSVVKTMLLLTCVFSELCALALMIRDRAALRAAVRRAAAQRAAARQAAAQRNAPQRRTPARPAPRPVRYGYR